LFLHKKKNNELFVKIKQIGEKKKTLKKQEVGMKKTKA